MEKKIGKIRSVKLGSGGYDDVMFGFTFDLAFDGSGVQSFMGTWSNRPGSAMWSVDDQNRDFLEAFLFVKNLLKEANKSNFLDLVGMPIEVTIDGGCLKSWRILTEVL